jgi:phosphate starvation-inducible protein PhoH
MPAINTQNNNKRLSRKEKRTRNQNPEVIKEKLNFTLRKINPLTDNQRLTFDYYEEDKHLALIGTAGTGKSFLSIYLGMQDITERKTHEKMIIIRSVVPTRDMGFLPGSNKEKSKVYEAPYYAIFAELFGRGDAYEYLKNKNIVEFMTTSFVRGITLSDCIIIVDEFQNMTASELHSVFTRIGKNCRVVFAGDIKQNDFSGKREESGFRDFFKVLDEMRDFSIIEFTRDDIVRSDLVKSYIIAREKLEEKGLVAAL